MLAAKVLAPAFRWGKLLENGPKEIIDELVRGEKCNPSDVSRVLRLTRPATEIAEVILDGQSAAPDVRALMAGCPIEWDGQPHACRPEQSFTGVAAKQTQRTAERYISSRSAGGTSPTMRRRIGSRSIWKKSALM